MYIPEGTIISAKIDILQELENKDEEITIYPEWTFSASDARIKLSGSTGVSSQILYKLKIQYECDVVTGVAVPVFQVKADGYMESTYGKIGGWELDDVSLANYSGDTTEEDDQTFYLNGFGMQISQTDTPNALAIGKLSRDTWMKAAFRVTHDGALYSTSGEIGGWKITSNSLKYGGDVGTANSMHLCPGGSSKSASIAGSTSQSGWVITAGTNFGVTTAGNLYATAGKIGSWSLGYISDQSTNAEAAANDWWAGGASSRYGGSLYSFNNSDKNAADYLVFFRGTTDGDVMAVRQKTANGKSYNTIFKVSNEGDLVAKKGEIGGWDLDANSLYRLGGTKDANGYYPHSFCMRTYDGTGGNVLAIGKCKNGDWSQAAFRITKDGYVTITTPTSSTNFATDGKTVTATYKESSYASDPNSNTYTAYSQLMNMNDESLGVYRVIIQKGGPVSASASLIVFVTAQFASAGGNPLTLARKIISDQTLSIRTVSIVQTGPTIYVYLNGDTKATGTLTCRYERVFTIQ